MLHSTTYLLSILAIATSVTALPQSAYGTTALAAVPSAVLAQQDATDINTINAKSAQDVNALRLVFALTPAQLEEKCASGQTICNGVGGFVTCINAKYQETTCPSGQQCFYLPIVNTPPNQLLGSTVNCTTEAAASAAIQAAGGSGGVFGTFSVQTDTGPVNTATESYITGISSYASQTGGISTSVVQSPVVTVAVVPTQNSAAPVDVLAKSSGSVSFGAKSGLMVVAAVAAVAGVL